MSVEAPRRIETSRLELAAPDADDAEAIFERFASDPEVTRYLGWPRHRSVADTRAFLEFSAAEWERWPAGPYLIRDRDDDRLLGSTGLGFQGAIEAMTGYVLATDAWGRGYATEALQAMVHLSRRLRVARLYALCHPDHRASLRVLEKCGFRRDESWAQRMEFPNLDPGVPHEVLCYERVFTGPETTGP